MPPITDPKVLAAAAKHFDKFHESEVLADILDNFASICDLLVIQPGNFVNFYPELKASLKSCRGVNLLKLLDERAGAAVYSDNLQAANTAVTVVGAGPIGLRTAIEMQLLGARVTVMEKRESFTRNNVLHLWPWVIEDLKSLGAKHFYPRFCTGTMNHISIRRLQCILLKTALVFGVEVFGGVSFEDVIEPEAVGAPWKVAVSPVDHPVSSRQVDVLIGAEGKHVTLPGFKRKEFRGKLAIAITANFKNKRTTAEAIVEEISGVAFVYKQDFFNNLYEEFGIALENIVYYKDDTHYFVMTTKKHSLLDRKVLRKDINDPVALLSPKNINKDKLLEYIRDACDYCTDYQLPHLEFALNHHGDPDVALFDFTSMFASGSACHVLERQGRQLLLGLVGDGLLEPFWPTGTGIARGFLGGLDAAWMLRQWAAGDLSPIEIMEERESILKLLPQTTPENITKDFKNISIVPKTRYPNLPKHLYSSQQVRHLYNSDNPEQADIPRYRHPAFQDAVTRHQLRKQRVLQAGPAVRMSRPPDQVVNASQQQQADPSADDFYAAVRETRRSALAERGPGPTVKQERGQVRPAKQETAAPAMTLKERIEARRAALDKEDLTESGKKDKNLMSDLASKAEFVRKMSKTFGYGMPSNAETKPDTLTAEAEKCALLVKSSNNRKNNVSKPKRRKSGDKEKKSKSKPARERECEPQIETWDFTKMGSRGNNELHSSVAPIVPELDIEIDPELDFLLAELEHDSDFSKLGENDQKAWLESLFYQDTLHLPGRVSQPGGQAVLNPRDQLNPAKSNPRSSLRVNRAAGERGGSPDPEPVTAVHVNDKMQGLAKDFFKAGVGLGRKMSDSSDLRPSPQRKLSDAAEVTAPRKLSVDRARVLAAGPDSPHSSPSLSRKSSLASYATPPTSRKSSETAGQRTSTIEESCDEITGVNKSLCSLAQSYFQSPHKTQPVSRKPSSAGTGPEPVRQEEEPQDEKASLVASFFNPGSKPSARAAAAEKPAPVAVSVPERASFQPKGCETSQEEEEEDEEIERLIREAELEAKDGPPVPARTADSRQVSMMRRLGNITRIMQGK